MWHQREERLQECTSSAEPGNIAKCPRLDFYFYKKKINVSGFEILVMLTQGICNQQSQNHRTFSFSRRKVNHKRTIQSRYRKRLPYSPGRGVAKNLANIS